MHNARTALSAPPLAVLDDPHGPDGAIILAAAVDRFDVPEGRVYAMAEVWSAQLSAN